MQRVTGLIAVLAFWLPVTVWVSIVENNVEIGKGVARISILFVIAIALAVLVDRRVRQWNRWVGIGVLVVSSVLALVDGVNAAKRGAEREYALAQPQRHEAPSTNVSDQDTAWERVLEEERAALLESASSYQTAFDAFQQSGGINPTTISSRVEIDRRVKLLQAATVAQGKLLTFMLGLHDDLVKRCNTAGIDPDRYSANIDAYVAGVHGTALEMNRLTQKSLQRETAFLTVLLDSWGSWNIVEGRVLFTGPNKPYLTERFRDAYSEMKEAVTRQQSLLQQPPPEPQPDPKPKDP